MSEEGFDNYFGAGDLVFNNDINGGIHSGGFNVNSIMMKAGMSPIITVNTGEPQTAGAKVSDLFNNLVIPNWALSYNIHNGGKYKEVEHDNTVDDDDFIDDDLHDKLLDLVKEPNTKIQQTPKKKLTRKTKNKNKKVGTRRKN